MPSRRMERINDLLRSDLSDLIGRNLKDPRMAGLVSVTEVETAADLRQARVFVSVFGSEEEQSSTLAALRHAAGFLRYELAQRVTLRHTPELEFHLDTSLEYGDRMLRLIKQVETPAVKPKRTPRRPASAPASASES